MPPKNQRPTFCRFVLTVIAILSVSNVLADNLEITFSGDIDGTDFIRVGYASAKWEHTQRSWPPSPVTFNGLSWNPKETPILSLSKPLIPIDPSGYTVRTEVQEGRDVAAAWFDGGDLIIHFSDTPNGPSRYSIRVLMEPRRRQMLGESATLRIQGSFDGSDRIRLTPRQAEWIHLFWADPTNIRINGQPWDIEKDKTLRNSGKTAFLPKNVDLTSAVLTQHSGRDIVALDVTDKHTDIIFADNPNGPDEYDVTVTFGGGR